MDVLYESLGGSYHEMYTRELFVTFIYPFLTRDQSDRFPIVLHEVLSHHHDVTYAHVLIDEPSVGDLQLYLLALQRYAVRVATRTELNYLFNCNAEEDGDSKDLAVYVEKQDDSTLKMVVSAIIASGTTIGAFVIRSLDSAREVTVHTANAVIDVAAATAVACAGAPGPCESGRH